MNETEKLSYHRGRALQELNLAFSATCDSAADAHYRLSGLHLMSARSREPTFTSTEEDNVVRLVR